MRHPLDECVLEIAGRPRIMFVIRTAPSCLSNLVVCNVALVCIDDDDEFSPAASKELEELVSGCILHCQVTAVEEDGVPYVMLTKVSGTEVTVSNS